MSTQKRATETTGGSPLLTTEALRAVADANADQSLTAALRFWQTKGRAALVDIATDAVEAEIADAEREGATVLPKGYAVVVIDALFGEATPR